MTNTAADRLQDRLPVEVTQSLGIQPACSLVLSPAASSLPLCHSLTTISFSSLSLDFSSLFARSSINTAKVSSLIVPRAISFPPDVDAASRRLTPDTNMAQGKAGRRRRSSSIIYQEPPESIEHTSDQAALPNLNANWVNAKGE